MTNFKWFKTSILCVYVSALVPPLTVCAEVLTMDETTSAIRVDGHLEDWPASRMLVFNQASQVAQGKMLWKGPDEFNGRVFLTYDSQNLYIGAIIQKSGVVVNDNDKPALWNGDCVEMFLSADPSFSQRNHLSKGDYHLGFSPGKGCQNPQMYCFNKNSEITGGRIVARQTKKGYVLEASVPLSFFAGLKVGKGKTLGMDLALDQGGILGGDRIVQMIYSGGTSAEESPSSWTAFQLSGDDEISIPEQQVKDYYAGFIQDGTQGANYLGRRNLKGTVMDSNGNPLAQARVTTWPRTQEVLTDEKGCFSFDHSKIYSSTVVYARLDGYASSLCPAEGEHLKNSAATIRLRQLPFRDKGSDSIGPYFYGQCLWISSPSEVATFFSKMESWVQPLRLNVLKLVGTECLGTDNQNWKEVFDRFVAYARTMGAEPEIEVPILSLKPELAGDWVRYCNVEKKYNVQFWAIGNEPDLLAEKNKDPDRKDYSVYSYINDYRSLYNAMKIADPSIYILGPELASKYTEGENDWFSPFLRYCGDIVNMASVHRYAAMKAEKCVTKAISSTLRHEPTVLQALKDKVYQSSDVEIPLVVTGGAVCPESTTLKGKDDAGPGSIWSALWVADELGRILEERIGMGGLSYLAGNGDTDLLAGTNPKPAYWAQKLFGTKMKGKVIPAISRLENLSVYATQNPQTKDVCLFFVSKMDRYQHVKIQLNNRDANVMVDAGLDQRFEFEVPSFSIACLEIKADRSTGQETLYTGKMALEGKEPQVSPTRPW